MAGFLDWIGERLDTPLAGVGIDPSTIPDAQKWAYRGRVIEALGRSIGTNPDSFSGSLDDMATKRQEAINAERERQLAEQMRQQMAQVQASGGSNAEVYRRYAQMFASQGKADIAKKYLDMADALDPKPDYGQPVEVTGTDGKPMLAQFDKAGNMKPVAGYGPKAADSLTSDIKNYQYAVSQGYRGNFNDFQLASKKAGASSVTIDTGKKMGDTLGTGIGEHINNSFTGAQAAQTTLGNVQQIRNALGTAITGPLADERATLLRVQSALGVAPGDTPERLAATRQVLQGLARAELAAAGSMKGQGAITENERTILKNAESGTLNLTPAEIKTVVDTMEATAKRRIAYHRNNVERLRRVPGAETVIPFYEDIGPDPTAGRPGAGGAGSLQDRAAEELRRRQGGR